jgi:hypothetical protein
MRAIFTVLLAAVTVALGPGALSRAQEPTPECAFFYGEAEIQALFAQLSEAARGGPCTLVTLSTDRATSRAEYALPEGRRATVVLAPSQCFDGEPGALGAPGAVVGDEVRAVVPDGFEAACPAVSDALRRLSLPDASVVTAGETTAPGVDGGWPISVAVWVLFALALVAFLELRAVRLTSENLPVVVVAAAGFLFALAVRASVPPAMSSWRMDLPVDFPWGDGVLVAGNLLLGAVHVPLVVGVMHEKRLKLNALSATAVLLALTPYHVVLSTSASRGLLVTTCLLAATLAWLRGCRRNRRAPLFGAFALVVCAALVRADSIALALFVPVFGLLRDARYESRRVALHHAALYYAALLVLWAAFRHFAPVGDAGLANSEARSAALLGGLTSLFDAATHHPHWVATSSAYLFLLGLLTGLVWRPRLMITVGLFVFGSFYFTGQLFFGEELSSVQPLMASLCILHIPGGALLGRVMSWSADRLGGGRLAALSPAVAPLLLACLAIVTVAQVHEAYARRLTFQAEHDFLRAELQQLPDGCVVYQVSPATLASGAVPDCCLDAERSPLTLAYPALSFRSIDTGSLRERLASAGAECTAYYESALCSVHHTAEIDASFREGVDRAARLCEGALEVGRLEPIAETAVTPLLPGNYFQNQPPRVRLFRVWAH